MEPFNTISNYINISRNGWKILVHKKFQSIRLISDMCQESPDTPQTPLEQVGSSDTARVFRCRAELNDQPVFLYMKEYLPRSVFDRLKHLFRSSRAMRAFSAGMMLETNRLHSPDIVAVLEKRTGPICFRNILITREISNAQPLYTFAEGEWPLVSNTILYDRRSLITELAKTIGRMHSAGIFHGDLRGGNLFAAKEDSGWRFYFIDNERTVKYRHLPFRLRVKNLVQLNMLRYTITNTERMRFFKAYRQLTGPDKKNSKHILSVVIHRTLQRLGKRARTRTGMPNTSSQEHWDFQRIHYDNQRGIFLKKFCGGPEKSEFIQHVKSLLETGEMLKDDISTRVVRCRWNGRNIVIKRYNHQGLWHSLRHTLKGSRARKCWVFGHRLHELGIATARPLGFLEQHKYGMIWQSYIVNEFVEGPQLYAVMNLPGYSQAERNDVMQKAEKLLKELGRHHLTHADMKPANMLIRKAQPVLIDLDSIQQHRFGWYFHYRYNKMIHYFRHRLHGKKKK